MTMTPETIRERLDLDHISLVAHVAADNLAACGFARVEMTPNDGTRYEIIVTGLPMTRVTEDWALDIRYGGDYVVCLVNVDGRSYYWDGTPMHVDYVTEKWVSGGRLWTGVVLTEFLDQLSSFLNRQETGLNMYYVEIVEYETGDVVKRFAGKATERMAERIEDGVNINLNHEKFYTRIVEE